ncbi:multicopper oxidase family protein [Occultella kanbiaonis]|uniref:multicopper oxidase family protein n=1 Tax=Occultella kanbiaonis TaxID=2675754 RepID=UPI001A987521|nr:multicopper oxidase domain-containing protein [Occultella kanbiaonis]
MTASRRAFLGLAGGVAATAVLAGCGGDWFTAGSGTGSQGALLASRVPLPEPYRIPLPVPPNLNPTNGTIDLTARRSAIEILPGRTTEILGYDGVFPGPTIRARSGEGLRLQLRNDTEIDTVLHLHGGRTPAEHDGYPTDVVTPGAERTYSYPLRQRAAPLWYHDHAMDFTGPNVYAGLAGMAIIGSDEEDALGLPSGDWDLPLVITDRSFDADGAFAYPLADPAGTRPGVTMRYHGGVLGDCVLVNGAPWPVLEVDAARYRFGILNASNARRFELRLDHGVRFTQVGTDGGLLERPVTRDAIAMAGAERPTC